MKRFEEITVKKVRLKGDDILTEEGNDNVVVEKKLSIFLNDKELVSVLCIPVNIKELVTGFLYTERIIKDIIDIESIEIVFKPLLTARVLTSNGFSPSKRTITSGCAGGVTFEKEIDYEINNSEMEIEPVELRNFFKEFERKAELFKLTGCVHSAALSNRNSIIFFSEDVGRHNAIDKVIGYALLNKMDLNDKIVFTSGRLSSEMITKCAVAGVPVVVSRCAPTMRALKIAENTGVTVIGFMRGPRFNVYTNSKRIKIQ